MPLYEHVYMARQDVTAQQVESMTEGFKSTIEAGGGTLVRAEYWGVKSLAYRIAKNRKAHYSMLNIDAPPAAVQEMERQMGLNEDVLRFMTIRVEKHEDEPSAMMQRRERDERRDRERGDRRRDRDDGDGANVQAFGDRPSFGDKPSFGDRPSGDRSFGGNA